jgi:hypothetical protein
VSDGFQAVKRIVGVVGRNVQGEGIDRNYFPSLFLARSSTSSDYMRHLPVIGRMRRLKVTWSSFSMSCSS